MCGPRRLRTTALSGKYCAGNELTARGGKYGYYWQCGGCGKNTSMPTASAVPKMRVNGRGEDVIFFDGVFFKSSLKSIFFVS